MGTFADRLRPYSFRGKARLLDPIIARAGHRAASVFGSTLDLDLGNYVDRMIYMGCYEPLNTARFNRILAPGMTVVDVGANIGYFTLLAAQRVGPGGQVFAIEPHPANFRILSEAVAANGLTHVRAYQMALGDRRSTADLSMADQSVFPNRTASMVPPKTAESVSVTVERLDACAADWGLDRIDLLKVDVDGFEAKVLDGARESLASGIIRNIIIELDDFWLTKTGRSSRELRALLEAAGLEDVSDRERLPALMLGPTPDRHFVLRR